MTASGPMPASAPEAGSIPGPADGLLRLVQMLSPAFPTGAFAYSQGLEWAVARGLVQDAVTLQQWLSDLMCHGSARADAVLLIHALRPGADVAALAEFAMALAPSRERALETAETGAAFGRVANDLWLERARSTGPGPVPFPVPLPIAVGLAARDLGLPPSLVAALYLQSWASALVQCGVRMIPLGQTDGQRVLAHLIPLAQTVAEAAVPATLDDIISATCGADLATMLHETQDVRMYKT